MSPPSLDERATGRKRLLVTRVLGSSLVCAVLLFAARAVAHTDEDHADAGIPEATPDAGHQTVVRSTKAPRSASEVVVARDVVDAAPRSGATDLLRLVPGLVASQHSGEGKAQQLFLRGFDAVHGQDVELNVAGLPVNEVSHLHALGYADLNWLIPETVREVRVVEGSTRAWQGDFAVAGTVRYELGLEEPGFTFALGHGSFNRTRLFAGFRPQKLDETFVAVEAVLGDGFGPGREFHRVSALGQAVVRLDAVKLRAVAGSYTTGFESPGVVRDALASTDFFASFGKGQGGASSRHQLLLGAEFSHGSARTNVEAYGLLLDLTLRNNFTGFVRDARGDGLQQAQRSGIIGARVQHSRHFHVADQVLLFEGGLGVRHDRLDQAQRGYDEATGALREPEPAGAATRFREALDVDLAQTMGSAWAELSWAPGAWRFMLGGRVDLLHVDLHDALAFGGQGARRTAFGPHLGLKANVERRLGEHVRLFLSYGDGFRSPQARQLSNGEQAPFVDVRGGELGVRWDSPRLSARLLGFVSWVQNDFFFDHQVSTTSFVGATLRGGAQVGLTARPLESLALSANFTAAHAQLLARDAQLPYFAPLVGRVDASWRPTVRLGDAQVTPIVGLGATFIGPRPLLFAEFSRAVFLLDARVGARLGPIEILFDVQNLLDSRWRDGEFVFASKWDPSPTASLLPARQFTAGPPRTFFVTLEVHL